MEPTAPVVVDCDSCLVRCPAVCGDCVVSVLLGPPSDVAFDADERAALDALAATGLVVGCHEDAVDVLDKPKAIDPRALAHLRSLLAAPHREDLL